MNETRFVDVMKRVDVRPGGCWVWTGPPNAYGYGQVRVNGRVVKPHRYIYEKLVGPLADMPLDHLCHNDSPCRGGTSCPHRMCVNPAHLEPTTMGINTRRGRAGIHNAEKERCPQGHAYNEENTYWSKSTGRLCRTCQARYKREWADRQKAKR